VSHDDKLILQTEILQLLPRILATVRRPHHAGRRSRFFNAPQGWDRSACRLNVIRRVGAFLPRDSKWRERATDLPSALANADNLAL